mgnify:CR=1 FL=1
MDNQAKRAAGFTLIELMIAIAVVAIIMTVALPSYEGHTLRTKRSLAKAELLKIMARQEQFFLNNRVYSTTLAPLGFADPYVIDADTNMVAAASTDRIYSISFASSSATAYQLQAVPQLRQAKDTSCGTLRITSTGVKSITGGGSTNSCW